MAVNSRLAVAGALTAVGVLAVTFIAKHEGLRTSAYRDSIGKATVCIGETRGVKMGDHYTVEQCKEMFGNALVEFETGIRKCLKYPDEIPDRVYVAALSLAYNIGTGAFCRSSIAHHLNQKNWRAACERFPAFNKAGGRTLRGLVTRRADERKLCLEGLKQ